MKTYPIYLSIHLYPADNNLTYEDMVKDGYVQEMYFGAITGLNQILIPCDISSWLFEKAFDYDVANEVSGLLQLPNSDIQIDVKVEVSKVIGPSLGEDPYRDKRRNSDKDVWWFPSYVQINNLRTKSNRIDSVSAALMIVEDLMQQLLDPNCNEVILDGQRVSFNPSDFDKGDTYINAYDLKGNPA